MPTPTSITPADSSEESLPPVEATGPDRIAQLLRAMDEAAATTGQGSPAQLAEADAAQHKLVGWRLGIASSLFVALRCKHPATADHSLRVAIGCSTWAGALKMPEKLRTQLEVAALLHDIGKIGVPDAILMKPGRLTDQELELIDKSREATRHILTSAGMPAEVVEGVATASAWFDGSHRSVTLKGEQTPFVARMIAVVDAFDSMTTDQVYRPARSRERAIATLFEQAGTQFDPELVASYNDSFSQNQRQLEEEVAERWLSGLGADEPPLPWTPPVAQPAAAPAATDPSVLYATKLVENLHDAVVYVDAQNVVTHWNTGAERMTGVGATAALGKKLTPALLDMARPEGDLLEESDCLITQAIAEGQQTLEKLSILGRNGHRVSVETHIIPVSAPERPSQVIGASIVMRDVSDQTTLEERCQALRAEMTKDPMTQVANRREFDRMLAAFVDAHLDTELRCSLIMADIDHFKNINDNYGHQAGDEAIMTFANLMKSLCRSGDLVARYGGEEFAILCADCNNATAAQRAEVIRKKLSETPHSYLGGKHITASFGVTELQPGDTPETLLRRSDRALLQAKDQGRNQVVQLGDGMHDNEKIQTGWWDSLKRLFSPLTGGGALVQTRLVTNVPIELAVDKLRGFIADRDAQILKTSEHYLRLSTAVGGSGGSGGNRRASDHPVDFIVDLELAQEHIERSNSAGLASGKYVQTNIDIKIQPRRDRDRRQSRVVDRARQLQSSLQSYLMAKEVEAEPALA